MDIQPEAGIAKLEKDIRKEKTSSRVNMCEKVKINAQI